MGRVSREQAAENRTKVVAAASALFRRRGLDGVGIAELMAEAGLTHGGFYGQFGSKDGLAGEACAHAFASAEAAWNATGPAHPEASPDDVGQLRRLAEFYFSPKLPGQECPMASLAGDAARAPPDSPIRRAFTAGLRRLANLVTTETSSGKAAVNEPLDDKALLLLAAMVGATTLRRASDDAALADRIQAAVLRFASPGPDLKNTGA